jgi:hypothetical protein
MAEHDENADHGEAQARAYPELARALKKRGADPASLFAAMAKAAEAHPSLSAEIVEVGRAYFVRYVWEPAEPTDTWTDFVLVNDVFEPKSGLALFAQLLVNGAIDDLRDVDAVLRAFEVSRAGYPVRTEKDAIGLVNNYADEKADAHLVEQWESSSNGSRPSSTAARCASVTTTRAARSAPSPSTSRRAPSPPSGAAKAPSIISKAARTSTATRAK